VEGDGTISKALGLQPGSVESITDAVEVPLDKEGHVRLFFGFVSKSGIAYLDL
jgi:hypothetical protein